MTKSAVLVSLLATMLGCAGARRTDAAFTTSSTEAPREAFEACVGHAPGEACIVRYGDVEATGNCAKPPSIVRDRRLICTT